MTREEAGSHAPGLDKPEQRGLQGEQGALGIHGLIEKLAVGPERHLAQRAGRAPAQVPFHGGARAGERLAKDTERLGELAAHARPLTALTGEKNGQLASDRGAGHDQGTGRAALDRAELGAELPPAGGEDDRAVVELGPRGCEGEGGAGEARVGLVAEEPREPAGLTAQPGGRLPRHRHEHRSTGAGRVRLRLWLGGHWLIGRRLEHDVRVGAADAEGRHPGPAGPAVLRPVASLRQQLDAARRPVHRRRRAVHVQRPGQDTMPHGHDHLDHARDARRRLRVPDVRLHRPQPQRPAGGRPRP